MLGVTHRPVPSWPIVILRVWHMVTSRFSPTEHAAEAEHAARTEHPMGAERTAGPEKRTSGWRRRRWGWLRPHRAGSSISQCVHHCSDQPGVRGDAVLRGLLIHAGLDRRGYPETDPGERLVLIRLAQIGRDVLPRARERKQQRRFAAGR